MTGTQETERMVSLGFVYHSEKYYALIRIAPGKKTQYHITVMNGELEKRLFGHHIISEEKGVFSCDDTCISEEAAELRTCILIALSEFLKSETGQSMIAN